MEHAYKTAILSKISYYLLRISALKTEINNLYLEKELLISRNGETAQSEAIEQPFAIHQ